MTDKEQLDKEGHEKEVELDIKEALVGALEVPEVKLPEIGETVLEEKTLSTPEEKKAPEKKRAGFTDRGRERRRGGGRSRGNEEKEFEQRILDIARVTRVTKGGKRMRFRSMLVIGDKKGKVGYGLAKGADVSISVAKAFVQAKKNLMTIPMVNETIPHEVMAKAGAAVVLLKPAQRGSGIKAGGAARVILELAGVPNVTGKILGAKNKINNVRATFRALEMLKIYPNHKTE